MADLAGLPNIAADAFDPIDPALFGAPASTNPPRILILYGSLRERPYSGGGPPRFARLDGPVDFVA